MGRTGGDQGDFREHKGSGCLCFWYSCDRGQSEAFLSQASSIKGLMVCPLLHLLKAFTGSRPFSELPLADAVSKMVIKRELPDRPQEQDLTDQVWDMTVQCWQYEPDCRPKMMEVVATLREWQVLLSLGYEQHDTTRFSAVIGRSFQLRHHHQTRKYSLLHVCGLPITPLTALTRRPQFPIPVQMSPPSLTSKMRAGKLMKSQR